MNNSDSFLGAVTKPYNSWSDTQLAVETLVIQSAMTDNPNFPNPTPSIPDFSEMVAVYGQQLSKAASRDANAIAAKNVRRAQLINMCIQLGNSVSDTANGDVEKLISSGLPLKKKPQSVVITAPSNFRITNGINPGELVLKVNSMKGVVSFNFSYTQDPPTETSVWTTTTCSTSRCVVKDLQSGKRYWFKVAAIGRKGQACWGELQLSPYVQ